MTRALPRSLYGDHPALAVADLSDFARGMGTGVGSGLGQTTGEGFEALYEETSQRLLRDTATETFEALDTLQRLDVSRYRPRAGVRYPTSPLGRSLQQIAFLIKAGVGLEVAFAESGGWDTHVQQGTVRGSFARRADDLSRAIFAFWSDLGPHRDNVVVLTMTEFGRTARENGSGGTDHGHGSCLFVLGNRVAGGKIHGQLPTVHPDALYEGRDLPVHTDFRAVFAGVAQGHLRLGRNVSLFPGWQGTPSPLITPG